MHSFPDLDRPLGDDSLGVRLAAERDIPEILLAYQDDRELHLRMGAVRPPSGAELGRSAERAAADRLAGRGVTLTIVGAGSDVCVGQISVHNVDWDNARVDLAVWVAPQVRGRRLAPGALRLVSEWLLGELGFERVQMLTEPGNERLLRAAEAAGFRREGLLRGFRLEPGARTDVVVTSLVRRDLQG